ncbi:MAG TPA: ATP-binding protein, partial [Allocoleopsis sp.]
MTTPTQTGTANWYEANQRYLMQAIAQVRATLEARSGQRGEGNRATGGEDFAPLSYSSNSPPALEKLCQQFHLSPFERYILLLCVGVEVSSLFAPLYASIQGDGQRIHPTFSLALTTFGAPNWGALAPHSPLRHWCLLEVGAGNALTTSPLRIDERILHYLLGVEYMDERLKGIVKPLSELTSLDDALPDSHQSLARQLAATGFHDVDKTAAVMQ